MELDGSLLIGIVAGQVYMGSETFQTLRPWPQSMLWQPCWGCVGPSNQQRSGGNEIQGIPRCCNKFTTTELGRLAISGPRTVKHVITAMLDSGGSALTHHQSRRNRCRFQPADDPAMEHESWCRVLHVMPTYDQLDTTNLAFAELVARASQRRKNELAALSMQAAFFMGSWQKRDAKPEKRELSQERETRTSQTSSSNFF